MLMNQAGASNEEFEQLAESANSAWSNVTKGNPLATFIVNLTTGGMPARVAARTSTIKGNGAEKQANC